VPLPLLSTVFFSLRVRGFIYRPDRSQDPCTFLRWTCFHGLRVMILLGWSPLPVAFSRTRSDDSPASPLISAFLYGGKYPCVQGTCVFSSGLRRDDSPDVGLCWRSWDGFLSSYIIFVISSNVNHRKKTYPVHRPFLLPSLLRLPLPTGRKARFFHLILLHPRFCRF